MHEFVEALERAGQLVRVKAQVDPLLELSEIAARVMKQECPEGRAGAPAHDRRCGRLGGKALLLENVRGHDMPVLINAFGSYRRIAMALGCQDLQELSARVHKLIQPQMPQGLLAKIKMLPELAHLASLRPKVRRGDAPCQQVVQTDDDGKDNHGQDGHATSGNGTGFQPVNQDKHGLEGHATSGSGTGFPAREPEQSRPGRPCHLDLTQLPIIQCWPGDGEGHPNLPSARRYITLGCTFCRHPQTGASNAGIYRVQVLGPRQAAMHIHPPHDGAECWRAYKALGKPMPAAIVFGGEPAVTYAASAPCPPGFDEMLLAGFLQGRAIELVQCKTIDLAVPANAEIVIEGEVATDELVREGPFGDHTGFYSAAGDFPPFRVKAITRRRDAIFPATVVGYPPMEDYYMGKATERLFLPVLQALCPEVLDYDLPIFGVFHNFVFVRIAKQYPQQARKVMHALWGAGQLAFSKFIVVVDEQVDVHDSDAVLFALGANVDVRRDIEIVSGPLDILDHSGQEIGGGPKMGIDATRKLPGEGPQRDWPEALNMSREVIDLVNRRWREYGVD